MIELVDMAASIIEALLSKMKSQVPAEVAAAVQAAIDALAAHKNDLVTKANLEANRG